MQIVNIYLFLIYIFGTALGASLVAVASVELYLKKSKALYIKKN